MNTQWDKLIKVVNRTNDKVFFFSDGQPYVIMSLDQYERSLTPAKSTSALTEEELLEKINRDIAVWKAQIDTERADDITDAVPTEAQTKTDSEADDEFHIEPVNI